MTVRLKQTVKKATNQGVALGVDLRLPTGDERNLLGTGAPIDATFTGSAATNNQTVVYSSSTGIGTAVECVIIIATMLMAAGFALMSGPATDAIIGALPLYDVGRRPLT